MTPLEESQTRDADAEHLTTDEDRPFLNSSHTHRLVAWFGPYARGGLEMS